MIDILNWIRNNQWIPYFLAFVLISFILFNFWSITHVPVLDLEESSLSSDNISHPDKTDLEGALKHPVFGVYVPEDGEAAIKPSSLDLNIAGIVYSADDKQSYVMIALPDGEYKRFYVGDDLPGGAQIKKITHDGLLIWYNDRLERIELAEGLRFSPEAAPMSQDTL